MAAFKHETVIRKVRFVSSGFTGAQMAQVGDALVKRGIVPRIQSGLTVGDSAAPALAQDRTIINPKTGTVRTVAGYGTKKARVHPPAIRNWTYSGRTLRSMKTLTAQPNRAVVGFVDAETNKRAAINNARSKQFGVSATDRGVISAEFGKLPPHTRAVQV